MWKEFKNFVIRGNVVDLAIGVIIGVAFSAIVNSLVNDIIMPPIGLALGKVDFLNLFVVLREGSTLRSLSIACSNKTGWSCNSKLWCFCKHNYNLFNHCYCSFLHNKSYEFF